MKRNSSKHNKKCESTLDFALFTKAVSEFVGNFWCFIGAFT